jgi:hypothetical protein
VSDFNREAQDGHPSNSARHLLLCFGFQRNEYCPLTDILCVDAKQMYETFQEQTHLEAKRLKMSH